MNKIVILSMFAGVFCLSVNFTFASPNVEKIAVDKAIPYELLVVEHKGAINTSDKTINITATKGSDLFTDAEGRNHSDNAPRVLFEPVGDFVFSAKVSAKFGNAYDGGAIIVYADEKNWGKLLFEKFKSGKLGIATTVNKSAGDDAYHNVISASAHYLKVVRRGATYIFYTSEDAQNWNYT